MNRKRSDAVGCAPEACGVVVVVTGTEDGDEGIGMPVMKAPTR